MAHRGPDGEGLWRNGEGPPWVALGHRRLAIIDLTDLAAQPMQSGDGALSITFNGEIFNYVELKRELESLGHRFRSNSDTEVLLSAYREWGRDCLERLNGMFAFAIWDADAKELFAARDRFGEKPFHYVWDERHQSFAFASEIKALLAIGAVPYGINEEALYRFVAYQEQDGLEETTYAGIRRLLPGRYCRLQWRSGRLQLSVRRYWDIDLDRVESVAPEAAAARFRELFEDSIRLRLRSDVPVGTSLSGGIDSSAVVCTIRRLGAAGGQKTFSARMEVPELDEGPYIASVLEATGIEGHQVIPTAGELEEVFPSLCYHLEEPFPTTSMFAQHLVMRLARDHRVTVLLDGQGADELLAGYLHYFRLHYCDLARGARFGPLRRELRSFSQLRNGQRAISWKGLLAAFLPKSLTTRSDGLANQRRTRLEWWNPEWLAAHGRLAPQRQESRGRDAMTSRLYHDALCGPLQELLRYGDHNSMAWSRELRQPFLDHRLAEFLFSLGPEHKISGGQTKAVLRRAMRGIVPGPILARNDKLGFQVPLGRWLDGTIRGWTEDALDRAAAALEGRLASPVIDRFRGLPRPLSDWTTARDLFDWSSLGECLTQLRSVAEGACRPQGITV
jgi:asparagine synthase (glutamine-hydrolysing)